MLVITQLVYIQPGKESVFDEFEAAAIPLIGKLGGELLLRLRPQRPAQSSLRRAPQGRARSSSLSFFSADVLPPVPAGPA
jgi:hypothetical protein